jgi:hypothetical protein
VQSIDQVRLFIAGARWRKLVNRHVKHSGAGADGMRSPAGLASGAGSLTGQAR